MLIIVKTMIFSENNCHAKIWYCDIPNCGLQIDPDSTQIETRAPPNLSALFLFQCRKNLSFSFWFILLTDRQTNRRVWKASAIVLGVGSLLGQDLEGFFSDLNCERGINIIIKLLRIRQKYISWNLKSCLKGCCFLCCCVVIIHSFQLYSSPFT